MEILFSRWKIPVAEAGRYVSTCKRGWEEKSLLRATFPKGACGAQSLFHVRVTRKVHVPDQSHDVLIFRRSSWPRRIQK